MVVAFVNKSLKVILYRNKELFVLLLCCVEQEQFGYCWLRVEVF